MKAILFDLDGTLLPMDESAFLKSYLKNFAALCARENLPAERMTDCLLYGMQKMMHNSGGELTNEQCFWKAFFKKAEMDDNSDRSAFIRFYDKEFLNVRSSVFPSPFAAECVNAAKQKGLRAICATNPLFPRVATLKRIEWAGLSPDDFELITTYEDYRCTKPDLNYYKAILSEAGLEPADCVMIGNDTREDMCAGKLGMETFLITDCLINRDGVDISNYNNGTISDCLEFIKTL